MPAMAAWKFAGIASVIRSIGCSDRRYTDAPRFPHLAMIGMVQTRVERDGKIERERRCCLSSVRLGAKTFANAVRAHWGA